MIDANGIAAALRLPCIVSGAMQDAIVLWESMYRNEAGWHKHRVRSLRIPSLVCKEIKRLTLKEFEAKVSEGAVDAAFQQMLPKLRRSLDYGLAMGGILFKPYWAAGGLQMDLVTQNQFLPISYTDDQCTAAACPETVTIGKTSYTRIEIHTFDPVQHTHTIENRCFSSNDPAFLGKECALSEVPAWAGILPRKVYPDVSQPLFSVMTVPDSNTVDPGSPLGISVFADAVDDVRDADVHWERILWELESSERAIDASEDLFRYKDGVPVLPKGRERMFRTFSTNPNQSSGIFETFSPEIRDASYFNAFNEMLRRVENGCGLSYGTLSRVDTTDKTAEEILSSKQRSFDRVHDIQQALGSALDQAVYAMQYLQGYYTNRHPDAQLTCTFGDGVFENTEKEFLRRMQMVTAGMLSKVQFLMWYFDCTEDEARQKLPDSEGLFHDGAPSLLS